MLVRESAEELGRVLGEVDRAGCYKAIALVSESSDFLPGIESDEKAALDLQRLLIESDIPVVAVLAGGAKGPGWLIAQFCDACVYSQTGVYSSSGVEGAPLAQMAAAVFAHRFGFCAGEEILLTGAEYSGADMQRRAGALIVAERDQALSTAVQVARSWARLPRATLLAWKKQTAARLREKIRGLPAVEPQDETSAPPLSAPATIPLRSKVVTVTAHPGGVVVVKMEDREAKNMFSEALLEGMEEAFAHIERRPDYKVVVLTGYDSYFASGGTKESLLAIQEGKARFTDFKVIQQPLDCKLPVIAAMQGHGVGAGWMLGMFADVALL
jgi:enoyl-CoA hydratase/carnithine racemase